MKAPLTSWHYSLATEADRLTNTLHHTANHFFPKFGFFVLPRPIYGNGQTVYLPDLNYDSKLLKDCAKLTPLIPMPAKPTTCQLIQDLLVTWGWREDKPAVAKIQKDWEGLAPDFWQHFTQLFPQHKISQVTIQPTRFGCLSSFDLNQNHLSVNIRFDMDISHLAEAIISGALMHRLYDQGYDWQEKEAFVDILLTETGFSQLFPNYHPTLNLISTKDTGQLAVDSQHYLKSMGITTNNIFSVVNNQVVIDGKTIINTLTGTEQELLKLFITNKNTVCNSELISRVIWAEDADEKYSPWAIAKTIQRLRNKLVDLGVSPQFIQAKRKEGYVLID